MKKGDVRILGKRTAVHEILGIFPVFTGIKLIDFGILLR